MNSDLSKILHSLQRNVIRGVITAGPLFITWLVFSFIVGVLASAGLPLVKVLALGFPADAWMNQPWFQYAFSVVITIALFYLVGRLTSHIVGRQAIAFFEASLERLPLINKIYGSVRQLVETLASKNQTGQRVVLIDFPITGQKSIGFLTHMIADATTGMPIAAVLVPQAINPSSAYLQFVPMQMITETDLTMEQAMSMLLTGGAVCPEVIRYSAPVVSPTKGDGTSVGVSVSMEEDASALTRHTLEKEQAQRLSAMSGGSLELASDEGH
ncbi:MAG TPA: DUF502 domain-containing protein [Terracidiphilus sp.]